MNVEIAQRLAELRREKGYSQEELAENLGLSRQAVSKWERAESSPDTGNIVALAKLYGVTLDELLRVDEDIEDDVKFEAQDRANSLDAKAQEAASQATAAASQAAAAAQASAAAAQVASAYYTMQDAKGAAAAKTQQSAAAAQQSAARTAQHPAGGVGQPGAVGAVPQQTAYVAASSPQTPGYAPGQSQTQAYAPGQLQVPPAAYAGGAQQVPSAAYANAQQVPPSPYSNPAQAAPQQRPAQPQPVPVQPVEAAEVKYKKGPWMTFPYPVLCVIVFLFAGFFQGAWHPAWIVFLTIPVYYWIAEIIEKDPIYRENHPELKKNKGGN